MNRYIKWLSFSEVPIVKIIQHSTLASSIVKNWKYGSESMKYR